MAAVPPSVAPRPSPFDDCSAEYLDLLCRLSRAELNGSFPRFRIEIESSPIGGSFDPSAYAHVWRLYTASHDSGTMSLGDRTYICSNAALAITDHWEQNCSQRVIHGRFMDKLFTHNGKPYTSGFYVFFV